MLNWCCAILVALLLHGECRKAGGGLSEKGRRGRVRHGGEIAWPCMLRRKIAIRS